MVANHELPLFVKMNPLAAEAWSQGPDRIGFFGFFGFLLRSGRVAGAGRRA